MISFGFFTTSTPYVLLGLSYLFYFVTAVVNEDLAKKWFTIVTPVEISSDDSFVELEDCIDYYNVAYTEQKHPVYIPTFASTPHFPTGQPHAAFSAIILTTPSLSRPPNA